MLEDIRQKAWAGRKTIKYTKKGEARPDLNRCPKCQKKGHYLQDCAYQPYCGICQTYTATQRRSAEITKDSWRTAARAA